MFQLSLSIYLCYAPKILISLYGVVKAFPRYVHTSISIAPLLAAPLAEAQFSLQEDTSLWEQVPSHYRQIISKGDRPVTFLSSKFKCYNIAMITAAP